MEAQKAQETLLTRQIRGLEEDNSRIANMYAQLTNQDVVVPVIQAQSNQHDQIRNLEKGQQDAKKGWKSVADDFGGSFGGVNGKSPGSAANQTTMRKETTPYGNVATQVTLKRNI